MLARSGKSTLSQCNNIEINSANDWNFIDGVGYWLQDEMNVALQKIREKFVDSINPWRNVEQNLTAEGVSHS